MDFHLFFQDPTISKLEKRLNDLVGLKACMIYILQKVYDNINDETQRNLSYQACKYIENHIDEDDLNRDEIASVFFVNPDHLSKVMKKDIGYSISENIIHLRINKAKELLSTTSLSISSIASSVGYSHFSHFAKMFKTKTGMTPKAYRKEHNER